MSGSAIGAGVGFVAGFFLPGGPAVWSSIGGAIGGYVDPEVIKQQGPRLTDATSQTAQDGIPITIGYATFPTRGNIIWRAPLVENVITDRQRQGKGGGPVVETTTYQYTRSYAIGICEGPIIGLLIVKRNGKIVYDARNDDELTAVGYDANAISASRAASAAFLSNCVVYLGDETQLADSVIESYEGVGNVEAFRGLAYIRFENDDLSELQGAIPQYEFVVNGSGNTEVTPAPETGLLFHYPLDDAVPDGTAREVVAGKDGKYSSDFVSAGPALNVGSGNSAFFNDFGGYMLCDLAAGDSIPPDMRSRSEWSVSVWCQNTASTNPDPNAQGSVQKIVAMFGNGAWAFGETNWGLHYKGPNTPADQKHQYSYGSYSTGGSTYAVQGAEINGLFRTVYMVMTYKDNPAYGLSRGDLRLYKNGALVDTLTNVPRSATAGAAIMVGGGYMFPNNWQFFGYVADLKGYNRALELDEIQANWRNSSTRYYENPDAPGTYIDANGRIVHYQSEVITTQDVSVASIVSDICQRSGLSPEQIDVSDLEDVMVIGYRIATEGAGDAFIQPLMAFAFFDCVEYDGKLRFVKRGGSVNHTLTMDDLAERDGDAIEQERVQEAELLRKQTVGYLDPLATYTPTTQQWERRSGTVEAKGEASIELPLVATGTTIAHVAEKRGKVAWSETDKFKFSLPQKWAKITPTDRISITDAGGAVHRLRVMQIEDDSGVRMLETVRDRQASYTATTAAVVPSFPNPTPPTVRGPTILAAFNGPPLTSEQNVPGIHVAGTGLSAGWIGFDLYISADGGVTETYAGRFGNRATIGWLTADIASGASTINVQFYDNGSMDTITDAQMDARQNVWAIVSDGLAEIGQSKTATLVPGTFFDTYDLTDNVRGIFGTETSHDEDDAFVVMDNNVYYVPIDYSYRGRELRLRAVSVGTVAASNTYTTLVYDPAEIVWDGNGDDLPDEDGPTPSGGGAGTPGTPTSRSTAAGTTTVSLTAGEANATANSAAINTAFITYGTVITPAGTYYIDTANPIAPLTQRKLDLATNNTILRAAGSNTTTAPATHRDIIRIDGKNNVIIVGGELIGYRDYWAANGGVSAFGVSEWGHGIYITNSSTNITIYNMTLSKFIGDGISVGRTSSNVHILNVKSTNNRRQGFSVAGISASANIHLENCEASYIGLGDGTSPKAGVDCEVDNPTTTSTSGITLTNLYTHHNAGPGVICYRSVNNISIVNLRSEYNSKGIYGFDSDSVTISGANTKIKWNKYEGIHLAGTCTGWTIGSVSFYSNKTKQYGTFADGRTTTTSPTAAQKAKHITIASTVAAPTYGTNSYGPV